MSLPEQFKNKPFVVVATLGVAPGKESRVEELLKPVVAYASSSKEPGTLTYRLNRSLDGKTIVMYEEYENAAGLEAHRQGEDYKKLQKCAAAEKLFTKFQIDLYEELKPSKSNL